MSAAMAAFRSVAWLERCALCRAHRLRRSRRTRGRRHARRAATDRCRRL